MSAVPTTPIDLHRTAVHEAGHAVTAARLGLEIKRVSIVPTEGRHGHIVYALRGDTTGASRAVVVKLAGYYAAHFLLDELPPLTWAPDYEDALACDYEGLGKVLRDYNVSRKAYHELCGVALDMFQEAGWQRAVRRTADALETFGYLTGSQIEGFTGIA